MDPVTYERRGAAALVTIDRQERRNAIDGPTAELIAAAYDRFARDDDARVLVITGAGGVAFCAGADLKAIETFGPRLEDPRGPLGVSRVISPKPTIAAISGWCLAGGLELALWCDLRIATQESALGFPERRWGVPLVDGGTVRLPRIVGMGRAMEIILTGRKVPAEEALRIGACEHVVPEGKAREFAEAMAQEIARFPQACMRADRRSAYAQQGLSLREAMRKEWYNGFPAFVAEGASGAARFASGKGRHGDFRDI
jgi:enoyl-CoA hydratase